MAEESAVMAAVRWIETLLLGSVAMIVAALCMAGVGFLMLSGRIDWRRGAQVILGCFILLGAPTIASGITDAVEARRGTGSITAPIPAPPRSGPAAYAPQTTDPYAGAVTPPR